MYVVFCSIHTSHSIIFYCLVRDIICCCFSGTEGMVAWDGNWVTFLDTIVQMPIFEEAGRLLRLPTRIRSLRIDPDKHEKSAKTLEDGSKGMIWSSYHNLRES